MTAIRSRIEESPSLALDPTIGAAALRRAVEALLPGSTVAAALKARSIFLRRELRHCLYRHAGRRPFVVLELGGTGEELLELLDEERWISRIDASLVAWGVEAVRPLPPSATRASPAEYAGIRFTHSERRPLDFLRSLSRISRRRCDLIVASGLLDALDDSSAVEALAAAARLLRPGGVLWTAQFEPGIPGVERSRLEDLIGARVATRDGADLERLAAAAASKAIHRVSVLDRGPNRHLLIRRDSCVAI